MFEFLYNKINYKSQSIFTHTVKCEACAHGYKMKHEKNWKYTLI